jgi:hypothetical protein
LRGQAREQTRDAIEIVSAQEMAEMISECGRRAAVLAQFFETGF